MCSVWLRGSAHAGLTRGWDAREGQQWVRSTGQGFEYRVKIIWKSINSFRPLYLLILNCRNILWSLQRTCCFRLHFIVSQIPHHRFLPHHLGTLRAAGVPSSVVWLPGRHSGIHLGRLHRVSWFLPGRCAACSSELRKIPEGRSLQTGHGVGVVSALSASWWQGCISIIRSEKCNLVSEYLDNIQGSVEIKNLIRIRFVRKLRKRSQVAAQFKSSVWGHSH